MTHLRGPPGTARVSHVEDLDRRILALLAADGRMSFTDLGKATGLSTSAVHQRVKRLEQRGVITGYGAVVDHDQLGLPLTAFISIRPIDPSQPDDSPERLRDITEIESLLVGRRRRVLHPQGPGRHADRPRGPAGPDPGGGNVSTRTTIVLSTPYENRPVRLTRVPAGSDR